MLSCSPTNHQTTQVSNELQIIPTAIIETDTIFDSSAIDDLIFSFENVQLQLHENHNDDELSCCNVFRSPETDNKLFETTTVEFITETIFNIFMSFRFG